MGRETYTLRELAERTGIEPRTIRSYIAQDLLRGPVGRGRSAHYTAYHLERLERIKALRDEGRGLDEIRRILLGLGEDATTTALFGLHEAADAPPPEEALRAYLHRSEPPSEVRPFFRLRNVLEHAAQDRDVHHRPVRSESWTRIEIVPDLELHVRGLLRPGERAQLRRIADHIRDILLGRDELPSD